MNVIQRIKNWFNQSPAQGSRALLFSQNENFSPWGGEIYDSDIIRACIRPYALHCGKCEMKHVREYKGKIEINPEPYIAMLLREPNPYMSMQMFIEKMVTRLMLYNNSFALIVRDEMGYPMQIYPINAISCELINQKNDVPLLKFAVAGGSYYFRYSDVIHLRRDVNRNTIFGSSNYEALSSLMEVINTTDQGVVKAVKNGSIIRWLLKFTNTLRPEDIKKQVKEFTDDFLNIENNGGGAAGTDAKMDAQQITPNDYVPNFKISEQTINRIYSYYGANDNIIQNKFTEDEFSSFYEGGVEPILKQISDQFTLKIFSRRERGFGNKIECESSDIQFATIKTKLDLVSMVDRGAMTPNEWRKCFHFAPIPGGDQPIRRLDTGVVGEGGVKKNAKTDRNAIAEE